LAPKKTAMQLAMADPEDFQAADFITKQVGGKLKTYMATPTDILHGDRPVQGRDFDRDHEGD
jgi:hypothetical protein